MVNERLLLAMSDIPLERNCTLAEAEAALVNALGKLGYSHQINLIGEQVYAANCTIVEKESGKFLASGNGKGEKMSSHVGSLFEATEHLFSMHQFIDQDKIFYLETSDFCRKNPVCDSLPLAILKECGNTRIPFLKYNAINGDSASYYPLALACPGYIDALEENTKLRNRDNFDYVRLEQYATNSGTAIGMNTEEALIHGLLESIERTSLSAFLTDTFLTAKNLPGVIDRHTLPENLRELLERVEQELNDTVFIFHMPNKYGMPAFCSAVNQTNFKSGIVGFGCSLSTEHAMQRSLYEIAQYFLLTKHVFGFEWLTNTTEGAISQLQGLPLHQDCVRFNLQAKCYERGFQNLDYIDLPKISFDSQPTAYLKQLTNIIYSCGEVPYASHLNEVGNNIQVFHTFITGEDRFFNVKNGKSTFPRL